MAEFSADAVVVGGGVAGLWTAKDLVDQGVSVDVLELQPKLGSGAITRNEGWLHNGGYHSNAIVDFDDARAVTERTITGHDDVMNFAPECVEEGTTFAAFTSEALMQLALERWDQFSVDYDEINPDLLASNGVDVRRVAAGFQVGDKSINSRVLMSKLASYVIGHGGRIFTGAETHPTGPGTADVVMNGDTHQFRAGAFVVAAGTGSKDILSEVTENVPLRTFKSHLLVAHRLTLENIYFMDAYEPGIMGHGDTSIVGINRDAIEVDQADHQIVHETGRFIHEALIKVLPLARSLTYDSQIVPVSCIKVDVSGDNPQFQNTDPTMLKQDLNVRAFPIAEGWVVGVPGKMTEASVLGRQASGIVVARLATLEPMRHDRDTVGNRNPKIKNRPADKWLRRHPADVAVTAPHAVIRLDGITDPLRRTQKLEYPDPLSFRRYFG